MRPIITQMLCNFEHKPRLSVGNLQRIQNRRKMIIKLDVDYSTNDGDNSTLYGRFRLRGSLRRKIPSCNSQTRHTREIPAHNNNKYKTT